MAMGWFQVGGSAPRTADPDPITLLSPLLTKIFICQGTQVSRRGTTGRSSITLTNISIYYTCN